MPLDVGPLSHTARSTKVDRLDGERATLGLALKAQRQSLDRTLASVADETRVRLAYLKAIEDSDWGALPSRPFAAGYARLYAQAVGLNGAKAVAAMKAEWPADGKVLQPPMGLIHQDRRGTSPRLIAAVGLLVAGVVAWNVAQRVATPLVEPVTPPPVEADWIDGAPAAGPVRIAAATPPPADQNAPRPYETPGLAAAMTPQTGATAAAAAPTASLASTAPQAPVGAAFNPRAAMHGAPPQASRLTVQARRAASVIVRRPDGGILFARQLAAGEAYRAPLERGLIVDVSEPTAFDVYRDGEFTGQLQAPQSRVDAYLS